MSFRIFFMLSNEYRQLIRERIKTMFILLTLAVMFIILTLFMVIGVASAGAAFLIVFGDVVVAIAVIVYVMKRIIAKKMNR